MSFGTVYELFIDNDSYSAMCVCVCVRFGYYDYTISSIKKNLLHIEMCSFYFNHICIFYILRSDFRS